MHDAHCLTRRVCTTYVPCLATILVLLLTCAVRTEAAVTVKSLKAIGR